MWKELGQRKVKVFDDKEEIRRKEEERKRKEAEAKRGGFFSKLRSKLSGPSLGEAATQARKDVTKKGFWDK
jgi:hypothetical protein